MIDLVLEDQNQCAAIKILPRERIDLRDFEILKAFGVKYQNATGQAPRLIAIAPTEQIETHGQVTVYPWESVVWAEIDEAINNLVGYERLRRERCLREAQS